MKKSQKNKIIEQIKKVELIYHPEWDSFMVKIVIGKETIYYPVVIKK